MTTLILSLLLGCGNKTEVVNPTAPESTAEAAVPTQEKTPEEDSLDCVAKCLKASQAEARSIEAIQADCERSCSQEPQPFLPTESDPRIGPVE